MRTIAAKDIAQIVQGELVGDPNVQVGGAKDIQEAGSGDLAFILHTRFSGLLEKTKASCVIVPLQIDKAPCTIIRVKNPTLAFAKLVDFFGIGKGFNPKEIHQTAVIGKNVKLGKNVGIGPYVVIQDGAVIGDNTALYPFSYIGHGAKIGNDCIIYPNVTIREGVIIGSRVIIHAGTAIGSDGFGYEKDQGKYVKIPQIGDVIIEDDVEIGSCVTIDRAKFAHTRIGKGTKIDNLVQIAHNVKIGENCILVANCGISGSTVIGNNVVMGGKVGVVDHAEIGDNVMIGAGSGVMKSIPSNSIWWGAPARPIKEMKKVFAVFDRLPEIYERLKALEEAMKIEKK